MRIERNTVQLLILLVIALTIRVPSAYPASVSGTGKIIRVPSDQVTIQQGIDAATDGDTVLVASGTYYERIDFHGKNITLASEAGPTKTVINGGRDASVVVFKSGETRAAVLSGFTITNGLARAFAYPFGGGVSIRNSGPTITNCVITKNGSQEFGGGISVDGKDAAPLIYSNTISKNMASELGGGIEIRQGAAPVVKGNVISGNLSMDGASIEIVDRASPIVESNTISNNVGGYDWEPGDVIDFLNGLDVTSRLGQNRSIPSVLINYHSTPIIKNNTIAGNSGGGIGVFLGSAPRIENNKIYRNRGWIAGGILVTLNSKAVIKNNSIKRNRGPAIWRDRTSSYTLKRNRITGSLIIWPAAAPKRKKLSAGRVLRVPRKYRKIQSAINGASDGDTVVVAPGRYRENLDFRGKRITVRSLDPKSTRTVGSTIVEGTVAFTHGEPRDAAVKGLTIKNRTDRAGIYILNSRPTIDRNVISGLQGSGIEINQVTTPLTGQAATPLITRNAISNNRSGISMFFASPVLDNNAITGNLQSGISVSFSHPVISNNRIADNLGSGIFVDHYSQPVVERNFISGNVANSLGGGIYLDDSCNATIDGNMIIDNVSNSAGGGLSMILNCFPLVTNNVFAFNSNGAIVASSSQPQILNDTFVGNSLSAFHKGRIVVANSILFDSDIILMDDSSEWSMTHSIDNITQREGDGNLLGDPLFIGKNDYHLLPASPAIDTGHVVDLQADIEGNKRSQGRGYDMGAYER